MKCKKAVSARFSPLEYINTLDSRIQKLFLRLLISQPKTADNQFLQQRLLGILPATAAWEVGPPAKQNLDTLVIKVQFSPGHIAAVDRLPLSRHSHADILPTSIQRH